MGRLQDKVAVISGASKGIGAAIAKAMAAEGASVVIGYASDSEGADSVVRSIASANGRAVSLKTDVANEADVNALFDLAVERHGRIDILVNNAGVYTVLPIEDVNEQDFRRQFDTNVLGTLFMIKAAVSRFDASGGSIVNIGSVNSVAGQAGMSVYSGTKGAIDTITRSLAAELAPRNIRVNTLAPGATETEGIRSAGVMGSPFEQHVIDRTLLGRFGTPEDVAKVAVFLASDDAAWVTGEWLSASGGYKPG
ncbi:glucose 1-dehydrogenase [Sphingomonas ginsenosidivorax]|uniref:Glucose 1-dehydrogenase n=1 Tax=Sphingomonas ginsenosidivorax TaxID=862135 RepID=A0A5C6UEX4_9SPHN|nr:glucose 1-dehydrogenase [Sphingomonas ginsenosidivorax]TXC71333.1 glucose 1-dehydrogenase [Sphingomonas ginsenosidivorax]